MWAHPPPLGAPGSVLFVASTLTAQCVRPFCLNPLGPLLRRPLQNPGPAVPSPVGPRWVWLGVGEGTWNPGTQSLKRGRFWLTVPSTKVRLPGSEVPEAGVSAVGRPEAVAL